MTDYIAGLSKTHTNMKVRLPFPKGWVYHYRDIGRILEQWEVPKYEIELMMRVQAYRSKPLMKAERVMQMALRDLRLNSLGHPDGGRLVRNSEFMPMQDALIEATDMAIDIMRNEFMPEYPKLQRDTREATGNILTDYTFPSYDLIESKVKFTLEVRQSN